MAWARRFLVEEAEDQDVLQEPRKWTWRLMLSLSSDQLEGLLLALIPALLVSVATAVITVRLSLSQFYSRRWWERKAEAYSSIIESLSHVAHFLELMVDRELVGGSFREGELDDLGSKFREGRREIERQSLLGTFLITDEVSKALRVVATELEPQPPGSGPPLDEIESDLVAVRTALSTIIPAAQVDLRIRNRDHAKKSQRGRSNLDER